MGLFVNGNTLSASELNATTILSFASASARDAAITAPTEGQHAYLTDVDQLTEYNGSTWEVVNDSRAWQTYTATWANTTLGSGGVQSTQWTRKGKNVWIRAKFTLGTGSAMGSAPTISFPSGITATSDQVGHVVGNAGFNQTNLYTGLVRIDSTTTAGFRAVQQPGTYSYSQAISASVPFTWASGAVLYAQFMFEAA